MRGVRLSESNLVSAIFQKSEDKFIIDLKSAIRKLSLISIGIKSKYWLYSSIKLLIVLVILFNACWYFWDNLFPIYNKSINKIIIK